MHMYMYMYMYMHVRIAKAYVLYFVCENVQYVTVLCMCYVCACANIIIAYLLIRDATHTVLHHGHRVNRVGGL